MKALIVILFLIQSTINCKAQNIFSTLKHDAAFDINTSKRVKEVITEITFYNGKDTEYKKDVTQLNSNRKIINETRYDRDGNKTEILIFTYDSLGRSVARRYDKWLHVIGHTYEIAQYKYDINSFLISVIYRNEKNSIFMTTTIINDEKGNPIEVITLDTNGEAYGKENATYDYENNSYTVTCRNNKDEIISVDTYKIDDSKNSSEEISNANGHITKSGNNEYEYNYDKNGNWIKMIRYEIREGKKIKKAVYNRKIQYEKQ